MKQWFSKLMLGAAVLLASLTLPAQSIVNGTVTNGVGLMISGGTAITQIQFVNAGSTSTYLELLDNNSSTSTNIVRPEYTYYTTSVATNTTVFTNIVGTLQTNNFLYLSRSSTDVSAVTNKANLVYAVTLPAGANITVIPSAALSFGRGVQSYATTATNVTWIATVLGLP